MLAVDGQRLASWPGSSKVEVRTWFPGILSIRVQGESLNWSRRYLSIATPSADFPGLDDVFRFCKQLSEQDKLEFFLRAFPMPIPALATEY